MERGWLIARVRACKCEQNPHFSQKTRGAPGTRQHRENALTHFWWHQALQEPFDCVAVRFADGNFAQDYKWGGVQYSFDAHL